MSTYTLMPIVRCDNAAVRGSYNDIIIGCLTNIGIKVTDELRAGVTEYIAGMNIAAPQKKQKKVLSEEEIRERELAKEAKKAEREAKKAEREAKKAEKAKETAAKKAEREAKALAKGTWGTTTNLWAADKKPRTGKNGKMLRIQKPSSAGHKLWPRDQCRLKVPNNWTEEALAEYKEIYGEPYTEDTAATVVQDDTPNVIENVIVDAMAEANSAPAAPAVPKATTLEAPAEAAKAPAEAAKPPAKKKKKKKKSSALADMKAAAEKAAAEKAALEKAALEKAAAEKAAAEKAAAEKAVVEENDDEMEEESDYEEDDVDDPTEWQHDSYTGEATIYKDADDGIYRYEADEDGESEFQLIGFYDIANDTITITK